MNLLVLSKSPCCCQWLVLSHLPTLVRKIEKFQLFFLKGSCEVEVTLNLLEPPFLFVKQGILLAPYNLVVFYTFEIFVISSLKMLIPRLLVCLVKENIGNLKGYQYLYEIRM